MLFYDSEHDEIFTRKCTRYYYFLHQPEAFSLRDARRKAIKSHNLAFHALNSIMSNYVFLYFWDRIFSFLFISWAF